MNILEDNYTISKITQDVVMYKNKHLASTHQFNGIIFLDRDGVLIEDTGYLSRSQDIRYIKGGEDLLNNFKNLNYALCIVTNQSGIGRNYYGWEEYEEVTKSLLSNYQNFLPTIIIACSSTPFDNSEGQRRYRKPETGMILVCQEKLHLNKPVNSILVGDKLSDIECGVKANIKKIYHVETGHGKSERGKVTKKYYSAQNIYYVNSIADIKIKATS